MNCFNHQTLPAIGTCKFCNKGLCGECVHDSGAGLACANSCIKEVDEINQVVARSKQIYSIGTKPPLLTSGLLIFLMFSLLFLGYGIYRYFDSGKSFEFLLLMGCGMLIVFVYSLYKQRQLRLNC